MMTKIQAFPLQTTMKLTTLTLPVLTFGLACTSHAFDLNEAWQAARVHSPDYDASRHARDAAQEPKEQAKARLLPQLSANVNYSDRAQDAYDKYQTHGWNVQISQPLFDKVRWDQYQAEKITAQLGDSQLDNTDSALLLEVGKAYFDILTIREKLDAVTAEKIAYEAQIEQAQGLFEAGQATIIDTYEAQSGLDSANVKAARLRTELLVAQNTLANYTGLNPDHAEALAIDTFPDFLAGSTEEYWIGQAIAYSAAVQSHRLEADKSLADIASAQSEHLPQLSLTAGYQDNRNDIRFTGGEHTRNRNKGAYIGVQFTIPIYSGGETASRVRERKARHAQKEAELDAQKDKVRLQVKQAWATIRGEQAQIKAQQQLLDTNSAKLDSTRLGRQVGVRNTIDEIKAEAEKAIAREQLAEAKYRYLAAYLHLLHLAGKLGKEEGRQLVQLLFKE